MSQTVQEIIVGIVIIGAIIWCVWRMVSYRHPAPGECHECPLKDNCKKTDNCR